MTAAQPASAGLCGDVTTPEFSARPDLVRGPTELSPPSPTDRPLFPLLSGSLPLLQHSGTQRKCYCDFLPQALPHVSSHTVILCFGSRPHSWRLPSGRAGAPVAGSAICAGISTCSSFRPSAPSPLSFLFTRKFLQLKDLNHRTCDVN